MNESSEADVIRGEVVRGKGEGQLLGFPTANIEYTSEEKPTLGIFFCRVRGNGFFEPGIAIVGARDDFFGQPLFEVHLLYYHENLYGQFVEVEVLRKIRDIEQFSDSSALIKRIEEDVKEAKKFFYV